jgi:hypothetical protein
MIGKKYIPLDDAAETIHAKAGIKPNTTIREIIEKSAMGEITLFIPIAGLHGSQYDNNGTHIPEPITLRVGVTGVTKLVVHNHEMPNKSIQGHYAFVPVTEMGRFQTALALGREYHIKRANRIGGDGYWEFRENIPLSTAYLCVQEDLLDGLIADNEGAAMLTETGKRDPGSQGTASPIKERKRSASNDTLVLLNNALDEMEMESGKTPSWQELVAYVLGGDFRHQCVQEYCCDEGLLITNRFHLLSDEITLDRKGIKRRYQEVIYSKK